MTQVSNALMFLMSSKEMHFQVPPYLQQIKTPQYNSMNLNN